jgi:hypothetical protein
LFESLALESFLDCRVPLPRRHRPGCGAAFALEMPEEKPAIRMRQQGAAGIPLFSG